jgi:glycosyltransferase involved in cell wall biosynthesis
LIEPFAPAPDARDDAGLRRVFLECTSTRTSRYNTGIQRAVRNLVNASLTTPGPWICSAIIYNGRYFEPTGFIPARDEPVGVTHQRANAVDLLRRVFYSLRAGFIRFVPGAPLRDALHSQRLEYGLRRIVYATQNAQRWLLSFRAKARPRAEFRRDDVLVLLDSTWNVDLSGELRRARATGAEIWVVVNDLIPIDHPDLAPEGTPILIDKWLRRTVPYAYGLLGISRAVADALRTYLTQSGIARTALRVDHFYLGAGLDIVNRDPRRLAAITKAFERPGSTSYLVVGTIEPRKNHATILNVFDSLWADGIDTQLVIFGRLGWRSDELARRIRAHPELGRRLIWFEAGSDAELDYAYRHASALIFASRCEGFGLPLVEAMQCGLPALASDIPVFREIGGDYPVYFDPDDAVSLRDAIRRFELGLSAGDGAQRMRQHWLSWAESARMLLEKVTGSASGRP